MQELIQRVLVLIRTLASQQPHLHFQYFWSASAAPVVRTYLGIYTISYTSIAQLALLLPRRSLLPLHSLLVLRQPHLLHDAILPGLIIPLPTTG
jgi:hypothetical protein